jgi:phenylpropionate dioxygenase-like ring-hydroxylating dioxygenase large terminal subunit
MTEPGKGEHIVDRYPFSAYPNGWFRVAYSDDLAAGEVKALRYFGRDLVLYRTEGGKANVLDAHCAHLGAHIGHGGCVKGEGLRCPFHHWVWDGEGNCIEIPYAKRIPPLAKMKAWPLVEKNGLIMVYHHAEGKPPAYEIPDVPQLATPGWRPPYIHYWKLRARWLDMNENCVDQAHFMYIHGTLDIPATKATTEGHIFRTESLVRMKAPGNTEGEGVLCTNDYGPGLQVVTLTGFIDTLEVNTSTPIDEETTETSFLYSVKTDGEERKEHLAQKIVKDLLQQFENDIAIWENKAYWPKPVLCDGDGPFGEYRKWMQQFF